MVGEVELCGQRRTGGSVSCDGMLTIECLHVPY